MTPSAPSSGFPFARAILLTLVAALLATVIWFGADILALRAKVATLETERDLAQTAQELAQSQLKERTLLAEGMINDLHRQLRVQPDPARLQVISLTSPDGGAANGTLLWDPQERTGSFVGMQLAAPGSGETHCLWLVDPVSGSRTEAGIIRALPNGRAVTTFKLGPMVTVPHEFNVSVEVNGSVTAAGARILLSGK